MDEAGVKQDRKKYAVFKQKQIRGGLFGVGMYADLAVEGWDDPAELREPYKPVSVTNERMIHGVILVSSKVKEDMIEKVHRVKEHFLKEEGSGDQDTYAISQNPVIDFPLIREGNSLPGKKEQ